MRLRWGTERHFSSAALPAGSAIRSMEASTSARIYGKRSLPRYRRRRGRWDSSGSWACARHNDVIQRPWSWAVVIAIAATAAAGAAPLLAGVTTSASAGTVTQVGSSSVIASMTANHSLYLYWQTIGTTPWNCELV